MDSDMRLTRRERMEGQAPMRSTMWREVVVVSCSTASWEKICSRVGRAMRGCVEAGDGVCSATTRAAVQDDDVCAEALDDFKLMRVEEDDLAAAGELLDEAAEDEGGADVEAGKGLVEEDELGVVQQSGGEEDLLAHALGVAGHRDVAVGVEIAIEEDAGARRIFSAAGLAGRSRRPATTGEVLP